MHRILGEAIPSPSARIPTSPLPKHTLYRAIRAWLTWCNQEDLAPALEDLDQLGRMITKKSRKDNLRMLTLRPWVQAIEALLSDQTEKSQLLFRRSVELGSQYGTEPVTQWIYVASFIR